MQSFEFSNEQLKKALALYCDDLLRGIPDDQALQQSQSFSARFEAKMQKLIQKASLSPQRLHLQMAKRVATIVLVFALGTTALMSVEAIRLPVIRFFTEVHQTFTRIIFGAEEDASVVLPEEIEQVFVPGFVPEGFALEEELLDESFTIQTYIKGNEYFKWSQFCTNAAFHLDTEGTSIEEFIQNRVAYRFFENKRIKNLIWDRDGYVFICVGTVEKSILIEIAESIQKNN